MAHHTSHRRILAAPNPQTAMDPTSRKPKSSNNTTTSAAAKNHREPPPLIHPLPDPTVTPPSTTIQHISHRFSKLYINHKKKLVSKPHPHPHPQPDPPNIQEKTLSFHPALNTSCTTLTKSSSQHERIGEKFNFLSTKVKVKGKDDLKKRESQKNQSLEEEFDVVKKVSSQNEEMLKGRNSVSSIPPTLVNGGERRRSFCSSQVELADFLSFNSVKVVAVDMLPFMQFHAVDCARKAHDSLEKFTSKTLALTLKKEFDGAYGPAWHCIVGTSFGSFVTHSVGGFMYFSMDQKLYILLFKTTVQRAE